MYLSKLDQHAARAVVVLHDFTVRAVEVPWMRQVQERPRHNKIAHHSRKVCEYASGSQQCDRLKAHLAMIVSIMPIE